MARYYVVKPNGQGIIMAPNFKDAEKAQEFADKKGLVGVVTEESVYKESGTYRSNQLSGARTRAISAVWAVGSRLLNGKYGMDMNAALSLELGVQPNNLTTVGVDMAAHAAAYLASAVIIKVLPTREDVLAHDPENDPSWPA